jgi:glycolate oxidase FAD binding subunit
MRPRFSRSISETSPDVRTGLRQNPIAMSVLTPQSEREAADMIRAAGGDGRPLIIAGGATRTELGRPPGNGQGLSSAGLTGVTMYEPVEMVFSAAAGTPLAAIETMLADQGQCLAFEPMDHRALFGTQGEPTIGGVAACNVSGPRRIAVGAARDSLIGLRLVNGRGEVIKSGGRVMKNVTGLDLVKLNAGALGTLGLITEVTFKVLPRAAQRATLALRDLDDRRAVTALSVALGSPYEISAAAHLPAGLADDRALTLIRIENNPVSVAYRVGRLQALLAEQGAAALLAESEADGLWRAIRDVSLLCKPHANAVWRISLPPSRAPDLISRLGEEAGRRHYFDWGGGLVWLARPNEDEARASALRGVVNACGGHATLVRAGAALRASVPVFEPLAPALMRLTGAIKLAFDPNRILNPGRMYAGI